MLRRSPFPRKAPSFKEGPASERPEHPKAKEPKPCAHCGKPFTPRSMGHTVCTPRCLLAQIKAKAKAEREHTRARKEKIKTIPDLIKEAQREFNAYVRYRDRGQPCICCGSPLGAGEVGGAYDCGHYRSTGSASHLRFDERNAHAQNKRCNRYGAGRAVDYRVGLIQRIGLAAVEALEASNTPHKWTREELTAIKAHYRQKRRELEKENKA